MKKKLNEKRKKMAYILNKDPDFDCSMKEIGQLFSVSQSTISNAVKEVSYERKIADLSDELNELKKEAKKYLKDNSSNYVEPVGEYIVE